jgi:hypothetical protein
MLAEHERVILTANLPEAHLQAGNMGVIVHIYADGRAYEVEFFTANGQTFDVVTVEAHQVRAADANAVLHGRVL